MTLSVFQSERVSTIRRCKPSPLHLQYRLKFYIRQQCAGAILRVLEAAATVGVLCRLKNIHNRDTTRLLFPKLVAMPFDQPEAQLYFGHQNKKSCSHCRRRTGRSAFRRSTPQLGTAVNRLYDITTGTNSQFRDVARAKLKRWGFNWKRRCLLPSICRNLLLRLPGRDEVFPCLDYRDVLHAILMFLARQMIECLDYIPFTPSARRTLDRRLAFLGRTRYFRDPADHLYRTMHTMFSETGMTAQDRAQLFFFLPHVFGPIADSLLPTPAYYLPLMTAISRAQLIVIAVRGLRCYTQAEFRDIFDQGYIIYFGCLQQVRQLSYEGRLQRHRAHPSIYTKPKEPLQRPEVSTSQSDTDETDDESDLGGFHYSHGVLSLIHQHWVEQVILAGSFSVHCTQSTEAAHKKSAKLASARVRFHHKSKTLHNMLTYLGIYTVFEHLKSFFPDPPKGNPICPIVYGVKVLLGPLMNDDGRFTTQRFQSTLLHEEIPVTRVELMDLLCDQFKMPKNLQTYNLFEALTFSFGQKFTTSSGKDFWATDSRYSYSNAVGRNVRRDRFFVKGVVTKSYRRGDGRRVERINSLCAEAVCFLRVSGLSQMVIPALDPVAFPESNDFRDAFHDGSITFFLVRWFDPHPTCHQRDHLHRPICPGPLRINHCLWTYSKTSRTRQSLPRSCLSWSNSQKRAYYGLIYPVNVLNKVNMTPVFRHGSVDIDTDDWLESVTLI